MLQSAQPGEWGLIALLSGCCERLVRRMHEGGQWRRAQNEFKQSSLQNLCGTLVLKSSLRSCSKSLLLAPSNHSHYDEEENK